MESASQNLGISLSFLKDQALNDFIDIVSPFPEKRVIAFPEYLSHFVFSLLPESKVGKLIHKRVFLSGVKKSDEKLSLFYITAGDSKSIRNICATFDLVPNYTKTILIIPRCTQVCEQIIKQFGYTPVINEMPSVTSKEIGIYDFHADLIPVEDWFFLMPSYRAFLQIHVEHDYSEIYNSARALAKIQTVFGKIPHVVTIGSAAQRVSSVMNTIYDSVDTVKTTTPQIDSIIIIDRLSDLVTPLLSQNNFEGIIDETFGIEFGICSPPTSVLESGMLLTDKVDAFRSMRSVPADQIFDRIKAKISELEKVLDELKEDGTVKRKCEIALKAKKAVTTKADFTSFIKLIDAGMQLTFKRTPGFRAVCQKEFDLLSGGEGALSLAENLVSIYGAWTDALRLLCLESLTGTAHSRKAVSFIQKEAAAEFGLSAQPMLLALDRLRLISAQPFPWRWQQLSKELDVVPDHEDPVKEPLQGYAPVSVRIVQHAARGDLGPLQKVLDPAGIPVAAEGAGAQRADGEARRVLVFFVGGVTLTEATLIHNLSVPGAEFIVGATDKISARRLMNHLFPLLEREPLARADL